MFFFNFVATCRSFSNWIKSTDNIPSEKLMELCLLVPADPVAYRFLVLGFFSLLFLTNTTLNRLRSDSLRAHLICQGSFVADSAQRTKLQYSGFHLLTCPPLCLRLKKSPGKAGVRRPMPKV